MNHFLAEVFITLLVSLVLPQQSCLYLSNRHFLEEDGGYYNSVVAPNFGSGQC